MRSFLILLWEVVKVVLVSLAIIVPIRYFLVQPFFVDGSSMSPNFENGEYLLIDEISYRLKDPQRGEVVVFKFPVNPSQFFIKRIIGLPGETIQIKNNEIIIKNQSNPEGFVLDESKYLQNVPPLDDQEITLGKDEFFVMGDNRRESYDSRRWGALPDKNLIGKVWLRAWPASRAQVVNSPAY